MGRPLHSVAGVAKHGAVRGRCTAMQALRRIVSLTCFLLPALFFRPLRCCFVGHFVAPCSRCSRCSRGLRPSDVLSYTTRRAKMRHLPRLPARNTIVSFGTFLQRADRGIIGSYGPEKGHIRGRRVEQSAAIFERLNFPVIRGRCEATNAFAADFMTKRLSRC